ncbi:MAG: ABC transporter permease subunit [Anaerolineales bacterium]|nr:ABC transporter permease subunit [Anaerolineales bacterium]
MDLNNHPILETAASQIRDGKREDAKKLLAQFLKKNPQNEQGWVLLSYALDDNKQKIYALKRILQINPANTHVQARLSQFSAEQIAPRSAPQSQRRPASTRSVPPVAAPKPSRPIQADILQPTARASALQSDKKSLLQSVSQSTGIPVRGATQAAPPFIASKPVIAAYQQQKKFGFLRQIQTRLTISWRRTRMNWRFFSQSKLALVGVLLIVLFGMMALAFPILINSVWPRGVYDPVTGFDINIFQHPSPPGPGHILGTDSLGRDVLSMILAATPPTFVVGLTAALSTAFIGTLLSVTAAYFRGRVDMLITNLADVFLLFPAPIIMVIIGARYRDLTPLQLGLIYGFVTGMGGTTIVMRAQAIQVAAKPFMEAAHIAGGGAWHIITKHLIPSVMPLAALQMMLAVTGAVVADGFISFFGITRMSSNWGTIIYDAFIYGNISGSYGPPWHMLIPAAACFSLFAMGFYLVSRGLQRVASPATRAEYR